MYRSDYPKLYVKVTMAGERNRFDYNVITQICLKINGFPPS